VVAVVDATSAVRKATSPASAHKAVAAMAEVVADMEEAEVVAVEAVVIDRYERETIVAGMLGWCTV